MMMSMIGARLNSRGAGAATACLLALALFAGPLCTGMCAGSTCVAQAANSNEATDCHGMSRGHGAHLVAATLGTVCRAAEASIAVASKPDFSVKGGPAAVGGNLVATVRTSLPPGFAFDASAFLSYAGPPLGIQTINSKTTVLRI